MAEDGSFLVAWTSHASVEDPSGTSVHAQRFTADGTTLGDNFQVNTHTTDAQAAPAVAVGPTGDFIVVWESRNTVGDDTWGSSIQAQRYAADGTTLGENFQVNTYTVHNQREAAVAVGPKGRFVVSWTGDNYEFYDWQNVFAQRLFPDGSPEGDEFQVNLNTYRGQSATSAAMGPSGDFIVVWHSADLEFARFQRGLLFDYEGTRILGQRYRGGLFADGFESNDTTAWSAALGEAP